MTRLARALVLFTGFAAQPAAAQEPEPPPPPRPWYEALELGVFADAYAGVNYAFPKPQAGINRFRVYDDDNGFALSWVGFDLSYPAAPVGGAIALRLGPSAEAYNDSCFGARTSCDAEIGLGLIKEAYVSWKPGGEESPVELDFGKLESPYGAEQADSQDNFNYTRGLLYSLAQPRFLTGVSASVELGDAFALSALAANGYNNSIDNNVGKTFGVQTAYRARAFELTLGWLGGPEQDDVVAIECPAGSAYDPNSGDCAPDANVVAPQTFDVDQGGANDFEAWRHLIDLVVTVSPTELLSLVLNASYGVEGVRRLASADTTSVVSASYYGAMLGARYQLHQAWAVSARAEYFADPDGRTTSLVGAELASGTLTIEASPSEHLLLRLDGRADYVLSADDGERQFASGVRDTTRQQVTTTLGVVVRAD